MQTIPAAIQDRADEELRDELLYELALAQRRVTQCEQALETLEQLAAGLAPRIIQLRRQLRVVAAGDLMDKGDWPEGA